MAAEDDDRTEEPTQRKRDEARRKGDIVYSAEVGTALSLLAATLVIGFMAGPIASGVARGFLGFIQSPASYSTDPGSLQAIAFAAVFKVAGVLGLAALTFMLAGLAARYVQDIPTFTAERLNPKLSKLNPAEGAKRVFGKAAASAFFKSLLKFTVVGAALVSVLWPHDSSLENLTMLDPMAILPYVQSKALAVMIAVVSAAAVLAGADYVFTHQSYMKRLRMSRREIKEETRQSEGDPMVKMKLRQVRMERARRRMLANVPKASVVVTNPTHYAVALQYEQGVTAAPICLAKGVDEVAARIREVAAEHDIPIVEDPPLARALFASADVDEPIPRAHYEAVAKVIGVVMRLAAQRRRGRQPPNRR
ncbi:MAG: flagellar biosynthesis protein FlhB [Hyphomonadaceae bacterium]